MMFKPNISPISLTTESVTDIDGMSIEEIVNKLSLLHTSYIFKDILASYWEQDEAKRLIRLGLLL